MTSSHIVKSYDQELSQLSSYAAQMGALVEKQFSAAIQAIHARDNAIAGAAFESDNEIDQLEQSLNELAIKILALRQPMASDLRLIIGTLKIARDLERMGDYAANLAKRSRRLNNSNKLKITGALLRMANLVAPTLREVIEAYTDNNIEKANSAYIRDDEIDLAYKNFMDELVLFMQHNPDEAKSCAELLFMAKNLERIGDRATNIAETVHFIATGAMPALRKKKILTEDTAHSGVPTPS